MDTTTVNRAVDQFNDALASVRRAMARGATDICKLSYYPTLKRRYAALETAGADYRTYAKATTIVQKIEADLFGEVFTYSLDATRAERAGKVVCWTCGHNLPTWQVEAHYTQCEACQIKAEKQFALDNQEN